MNHRWGADMLLFQQHSLLPPRSFFTLIFPASMEALLKAAPNIPSFFDALPVKLTPLFRPKETCTYTAC